MSQVLSKARFQILIQEIQTNISLSEKKCLEVEFKKDVPYWQRLNWQVQDDIWNDIRMNSKHGFTLFQRFLKENKDLVIQANGNGIDIVKEYQDKFCKTADQYGLRGRQTLKSQQLKQKLSTSPDAFEEILFKKIINFFKGIQQEKVDRAQFTQTQLKQSEKKLEILNQRQQQKVEYLLNKKIQDIHNNKNQNAEQQLQQNGNGKKHNLWKLLCDCFNYIWGRLKNFFNWLIGDKK